MSLPLQVHTCRLWSLNEKKNNLWKCAFISTCPCGSVICGATGGMNEGLGLQICMFCYTQLESSGHKKIWHILYCTVQVCMYLLRKEYNRKVNLHIWFFSFDQTFFLPLCLRVLVIQRFLQHRMITFFDKSLQNYDLFKTIPKLYVHSWYLGPNLNQSAFSLKTVPFKVSWYICSTYISMAVGAYCGKRVPTNRRHPHVVN